MSDPQPLPPSEAAHDLAHALVNAMAFVRFMPLPEGHTVEVLREAPEVIALARALDRWTPPAVVTSST